MEKRQTGCGNQNKNITPVGLYCELAKKGVYSVINHKFLTRGHTFLPNDTDFAQIEKRKKTAVVHLPCEWIDVVEKANQKKPFKVQKMERPMFKNYKAAYKSVYRHKRQTINKEPLSFKKVRDKFRL